MIQTLNTDLSIRVLVTDAVTMSCRLLADALHRRKPFHAVAGASAKKAFRLLASSRFDVILVGIGAAQDHLERIRLIRQVRTLYPELSIIVLLDSLERTLVVETFRCGARGVFCRADSFEALCKCIQCVHEGQVWAGSAELRFVLEALADEARPAVAPALGARPLSQREEQITRLVAEGFSNRQISERLQLSEHTIKNYLFRVFEKLGVSTRVGLTLYALKHAAGSGQEQLLKPLSLAVSLPPPKYPGIPPSN